MSLFNVNESNYTKVYGVDSLGNVTFKGEVTVPTKKIRAKCSFPHRRYNPKLDVCKKAIKNLKAFKMSKKNFKQENYNDPFNEFYKLVDREFIDKVEESKTTN